MAMKNHVVAFGFMTPCSLVVGYQRSGGKYCCLLQSAGRPCHSSGAVSRRFPAATPRVRSQVRFCGICSRQSGTGVGILRVLRFPLPILIPLTAPQSSFFIIRNWYNRPNSGRRTMWTQSYPTLRN
jgi:hypothetical protein